MTEHAPELEATQARQARRGLHVYRILMISLALVVVAFLVIWAIFAPGFVGKRGNREAPPNVAQSVTVTPNSVKEASAGAAPGSVPAQATGREERSTGGG